MNSHFDLIGAFVVKILYNDQSKRLSEALESLAFTTYLLDLADVKSQFELFDQLYGELNLADYCPGVPTGWDSLSDCMWQKIMFRDVAKMAFRIRAPAPKLVELSELLFQLAEVLVLLEQAVCKAREEDGGTPLRLRMFIET